MASELGKRYECDACGGQLLVVMPGPGELVCCSEAMTVVQPKQLPSSD